VVLDPTATSLPQAAGADDRRRRQWPIALSGLPVWITGAAVLILISVAFVFSVGMRPGYDAYGWLVWGHQTLHWNLNTDGAPSWKPLTFLFTLPYSLTGRAAVSLWMVTAVAGALAGCVFAARIAYRLTGPAPRRRWAPLAAGAFAAIAVLGVDGYWPLVLIANSDPMIVSLLLAAIDAQLSGRPRLAFGLLALAALGRPEVWLFVGLFALWAWRSERSMRPLLAAGVALIPILWFGVPALTSKSWLSPADLALNSVNVIHGSKIMGVLERFLALNWLAIKLAALLACGLALARRDRATLLIAAAALLWVALEAAFALHGWSAAPRFLVEPAALVAVLAGATVGRLLTLAPPGLPLAPWAGAVAAVILIAALVSPVRTREQAVNREVLSAQLTATKIGRLQAVIVRDGGAAQLRACGQPVSLVGYQSTLAYYVGLNVGEVGYRPGHAIDSDQPIVLFKPYRSGWEIRPNHVRAGRRGRCRRLARTYGVSLARPGRDHRRARHRTR